MVFNVTFKNISVISWRSGLLLEETEVHVENGAIKTTSVGRHVAPLGHIILISDSEPLFFLYILLRNETCFAEKQQLPI